MASERQCAANRQNARRSTGPRTSSGKAISSQNAFRHGLSARLGEDPEQDQRVEAMAQILAGQEAGPSQLHYARVAADATLRIGQIRSLRSTLMDPAAREREAFSWSMPRRVHWRRRYRAGQIAFPEGTGPLGTEFWQKAAPLERFPPPPSGPGADLVILGRFMEKVLKLDRYERRELSRRKTALRALDALRARA